MHVKVATGIKHIGIFPFVIRMGPKKLQANPLLLAPVAVVGLVLAAGISPMKISNQIFYNKLVLITGGSSGIGLALARQLTMAGADVYILARRLEYLTNTILELKVLKVSPDQRIGLVSADVSREKTTLNIIEKFIQKVGSPDYLINSAGITYPGTTVDLPMEIYRSMMEVNYFGMVTLIKAVLPSMVNRGSGHIVNISSLVGFYASYGYSAYAASKFAVKGFSDVLRAELKPTGIRVSVVFPADVDTPQLAYEHTLQPEIMRDINAAGGLMSPEEVAKLILKDVAKNRYIITPGFQSKLAYFVSQTAGYLLYPIMDFLVSNGLKKAVRRGNQKY